jgi:hypothetical protein
VSEVQSGYFARAVCNDCGCETFAIYFRINRDEGEIQCSRCSASWEAFEFPERRDVQGDQALGKRKAAGI